MPRMNEEKHGGSREAASATDHLKEHASEIGQDVRDLGGELGDAAREKFNEFRDQATGYYKKGRKKAAELEGGIEDYIKDQPIKAMMIAAGVGMLFGLFWRRR